MTAVLACRSVSVSYGEVVAVDGVDLEVAAGETVALLGPSGSGKSTLLYAIAGFVDVDAGEISLGGEVVSTSGVRVAPEHRSIGLVFQNYALWPHLDARDTVAYPFRRAGMSRERAAARAEEILDMLGIGELADRTPAEMSGGQQQRVGLGRALAREARLSLFDEPTAHLDAGVREAVLRDIAARRRETGAGALYATHDSAEALSIADRVAVLRDGRVVQQGTPVEIYEEPVDVWAARLTGPAALLTATVDTTDAGESEVRLGPVVIEAGGSRHGGTAEVVVRPEWVSLGGPIEGVVEEVWFRGPHTDHRIATPAGLVEVRHPGPPSVRRGERIGCTIHRGWIV